MRLPFVTDRHSGVHHEPDSIQDIGVNTDAQHASDGFDFDGGDARKHGTAHTDRAIPFAPRENQNRLQIFRKYFDDLPVVSSSDRALRPTWPKKSARYFFEFFALVSPFRNSL